MKEYPTMKRPVLLVIGLSCLLGSLLVAEEPKKFSYVDLQPKVNQKLADNLGLGREGNNLANLPKGEPILEEVRFKIADGFLQLGSTWLKEPKPDRIDSIKVGKAFAKLHLLHATIFGNPGAGDIADDTVIAKYEIHYAGGDTATIPVLYGKDVRDWFRSDDPKAKEVTRGKVAWTGDNEVAKREGTQIRLFLGTWENPYPTKKVVSIDYVKVGDTAAAPICVAMTLEEQ